MLQLRKKNENHFLDYLNKNSGICDSFLFYLKVYNTYDCKWVKRFTPQNENITEDGKNDFLRILKNELKLSL